MWVIDQEGVVSRLNKCLYGLRQAAYEFNQDFDKELKRLGMQQSKADPCFYHRQGADGWILLAGHVDDAIGAADNLRVYQAFTKAFKYPLSALGPLKYVPKISVRSKDGAIYLGREKYITDMCAAFGVEDANPKYTPIKTSAKYDKSQCPAADSEEAEEM